MGSARWLQILLIGFLVGIALTAYSPISHLTIIWLSFASIIFQIVPIPRIAKPFGSMITIGLALGLLRGLMFPQTIAVDQNLINQLRARRSQTIDQLTHYLPEPEGHLAASIVLGGEGILPSELKQPMIRTGTIHMAAVSGANLTIILQLSSVSLSFLLGRWLGFSIGSLAIVLFLGLTGFEPSIIRASLLGWFFLLARANHRLTNPLYLATLAASLMILIQPKLIADVGFQLSFASYLGLLLFESNIEHILGKNWLIGRLGIIRQALSATLAAQILSLPLIIFYFGRISLVSIPANIVVGYLVTITMFLGVFTVGLSALSGVANWLGFILVPFSWAIQGLVRWFDQLPFASTTIPTIDGWVILGYYLIVGLIMFQQSVKRVPV